jgi:glycosyltransferase involved in cell wall biosynthesis
MRIAVVIPTFNDGASLGLAAASAIALRERGGDQVHVIVVDDGSNPPATVSDSTHVEIIQQVNAGPSAARNAGMERALAIGVDWVIFLDADDQLLPGVIDSIHLAQREGWACVLSARREVRLTDAGTEISTFRKVPPEWEGKVLPSPGDVWRPIFIFGTTGVVIHQRVMEAGLRFDVRIKHGQDREFLRRVAAFGPLGISPHEAVRYTLRGDGGNVSGRKHLATRTRDFVLMMDQWCDDACRHHWQEASVWLLNQLSKYCQDAQAFASLTSAMHRHGLKVPIKPRLRWMIRRMLHRPT